MDQTRDVQLHELRETCLRGHLRQEPCINKMKQKNILSPILWLLISIHLTAMV